MTANSDIKISVVIPVFNRAKTIEYALRSVLAQTYPAAEVIIVDDCSTDNTLEKLKTINDPRIVVIKQEKNQGAQAARNRGIKEAKYPWIAFHDSDDEWLPTRLEEGVKALASVNFEPFTLVHSNCIKYFEATGKKELWELPAMEGSSVEVLPKVLKEPGPMFQGMLTSRAALEKIGLLDEKVPAYQEWETAIRLAQCCRFIHIKEPLFQYHFHGGEAISKGSNSDISGYHFNRLKHKEETVAILGKVFYDENVRWNIERAFHRGAFPLAKQLIQDTYSPSSSAYIYLITLAGLGLSPEKIRHTFGLLKAPFRPFKRLLVK